MTTQNLSTEDHFDRLYQLFTLTMLFVALALLASTLQSGLSIQSPWLGTATVLRWLLSATAVLFACLSLWQCLARRSHSAVPTLQDGYIQFITVRSVLISWFTTLIAVAFFVTPIPHELLPLNDELGYRVVMAVMVGSFAGCYLFLSLAHSRNAMAEKS